MVSQTFVFYRHSINSIREASAPLQANITWIIGIDLQRHEGTTENVKREAGGGRGERETLR